MLAHGTYIVTYTAHTHHGAQECMGLWGVKSSVQSQRGSPFMIRNFKHGATVGDFLFLLGTYIATYSLMTSMVWLSVVDVGHLHS